MWRRMVLVGIGDSDIMGRLVAACRGLSLVIVPEWPAKSEQPSERIKQRAREEKLRKLCAAYDRVTLLEPDAVPEGVFDAAVLLGLGDDLADVGGVYAALVRDGGWLMGDDTRDAGTRAILAAVAPGWARLDDGMWCVKVKRDAGADDPLDSEIAPVVGDEAAQGEPLAIGEAVAVDAESTVGLFLSEEGDDTVFGHDPTHSGPDVDEPTIAPKRRGGRPKGSRNKAKAA
jgi:hypothetical protein